MMQENDQRQQKDDSNLENIFQSDKSVIEWFSVENETIL